MTLALLDGSDVVLSIVTYDSTTIHNTIAVAEVFASIGYPAEKMHYLVNRSDSSGGIGRDELARALGAGPTSKSYRTAASSFRPTTRACPSWSRAPMRRSVGTCDARPQAIMGRTAGAPVRH